MLTRRASVLLLLAACQRAPSAAQDAATYARILAQAGQDPEAELTACAALGDVALRGDCAAVVAVAAARSRGDAAAWCARVPAGTWRDECTFQTAESALTTQGASEATALCQQAGAFQADCLVHVWQPQLGRITDRMTAAAFSARYAAADQLYQQTAASAGATASFESMYWLSYFGTGFRNSGGVDLGWCAPLTEEGARRCADAAAVLLTEPLERLLRQSGQLQAFCALSPPMSQDVSGLLRVAPSEALDRALVAQQPMICGVGGTALSGGLVTQPGSAGQGR